MARVSTCHSISFDQASEQRFSWCADRSRAWSDLFSQKVGHLPINDGAREVPSSKKNGLSDEKLHEYADGLPS